MTNQIRLAFLCACAISFWSCQSEAEAEEPVYLSLPGIDLVTDYPEEGTAQHKITTAWVYANQEPIGAFELPAVIPAILPEGPVDFTIYPGVNLNGVQSLRTIIDAYQPIQVNRVIDLDGEIDTLKFTSGELSTRYRDSYKIIIVEDFDESGLNLESLSRSDTNIFKVDDPDSTFDYRLPDGSIEDNEKAGFVALDDERNTLELASVNSYQFPRGLSNVFLEVTYRTNVNLNFGVEAQSSGGNIKAITAAVFPKEEWSKIYIDLISEVQAYQNADGFKLYITAQKPAGLTEGRIFIDNLKIVHLQ